MPEPADVVHEPDAERYVLRDGGEELGHVDYRPAGASIILAHTETASGHEGKGVAGTLVAGTLEDVEARGLTVIPVCPFAKAWISRHPEWIRVVKPELRSQVGG